MGILAVAPAAARFIRYPSHRIIPKAAIVAGVTAAVMGAFPHTARAQLPTINIKDTCRAAAGVMVSLMSSTTQNDVEICLESEEKARQQILKDWSSYLPSDRAFCVQANVYLPSYIEWLTCFEMNKVVRDARKAQGTPLPHAGTVVTLPRVRSGRPY
jgi:hypothetical protein